MPLINCEINLIRIWSENYLIINALVNNQLPKFILDYSTDPSFPGVNRFFVLSFANNTGRTSYKTLSSISINRGL